MWREQSGLSDVSGFACCITAPIPLCWGETLAQTDELLNLLWRLGDFDVLTHAVGPETFKCLGRYQACKRRIPVPWLSLVSLRFLSFIYIKLLNYWGVSCSVSFSIWAWEELGEWEVTFLLEISQKWSKAPSGMSWLLKLTYYFQDKAHMNACVFCYSTSSWVWYRPAGVALLDKGMLLVFGLNDMFVIPSEGFYWRDTVMFILKSPQMSALCFWPLGSNFHSRRFTDHLKPSLFRFFNRNSMNVSYETRRAEKSA